jgi:hypothetical protein
MSPSTVVPTVELQGEKDDARHATGLLKEDSGRPCGFRLSGRWR